MRLKMRWRPPALGRARPLHKNAKAWATPSGQSDTRTAAPAASLSCAASAGEGRRPHHHRAGTSSGLDQILPPGFKAPTQQGQPGLPRNRPASRQSNHPARCRPAALAHRAARSLPCTAARQRPTRLFDQNSHFIESLRVTRHDPQTRPSAFLSSPRLLPGRQQAGPPLA